MKALVGVVGLFVAVGWAGGSGSYLSTEDSVDGADVCVPTRVDKECGSNG